LPRCSHSGIFNMNSTLDREVTIGTNGMGT